MFSRKPLEKHGIPVIIMSRISRGFRLNTWDSSFISLNGKPHLVKWSCAEYVYSSSCITACSLRPTSTITPQNQTNRVTQVLQISFFHMAGKTLRSSLGLSCIFKLTYGNHSWEPLLPNSTSYIFPLTLDIHEKSQEFPFTKNPHVHIPWNKSYEMPQKLPGFSIIDSLLRFMAPLGSPASAACSECGSVAGSWRKPSPTWPKRRPQDAQIGDHRGYINGEHNGQWCWKFNQVY